jgi:Heparinase II/III-like protein/Heparinase II/III N-terminus
VRLFGRRGIERAGDRETARRPGDSGYPRELLESDLYLMAGPAPPDFQPRTDRPAWRLTLPLDWAVDPFGDDNWRFHLHVWRMIDPLILRWFREREPAMLREMFAYPRDWWRYHRAGGSTAHSWSDMASGVRALKLAFLVERWRLGDLVLDREEKAVLLALVDAHAGFLGRRRNVRNTNHGLLQAIAYRQLCRQAPDRRSCRRAHGRSAAYMRRIIARQFSPEGIHREHSPGYHFFVTDLLAQLRVAELFVDVKEVAEIARRAHANRGWFVFPDGEVSRIGDNAYSGVPIAVANRTEILGGREYAVGDFSRSGYAIVRTLGSGSVERQSMLVMTAMFHSNVHKHADDLSFELFDAGQRILVDSGRYDFQWNAMRAYVFSAAAHNTVDLADAPIIRKQTRRYGSGLAPIRVEDGAFVLSGRVRRAGKFDHVRILRYRPGVWLAIDDELESDEERQYVSRLHFSFTLTVAPDEDRYVVLRGDRKLAVVEPPADARVELVRGREDPLLGWETVGRREMAPIHVLEAHLPGKRKRMRWRIALYPP